MQVFVEDQTVKLDPPAVAGLEATVIGYRHSGTGHYLVVTLYIPPIVRGHMIFINSRNSYCFHGPLLRSIVEAGFALYVVDPPSHGINQRLGPAQNDSELSYHMEFRLGVDFVLTDLIGADLPVRAIGDRVGGILLQRYQQSNHRYQFQSLCLLSPLVDLRNVTCQQTFLERLLFACGGTLATQSPRWSFHWYKSHGYEVDRRYYPSHHSTADTGWFQGVVQSITDLIRLPPITAPVFVIVGDRESNIYIERTKQLFRRSCENLHLTYARSCERWGVVVHDDLINHHLQTFLRME
jgi:alpha-beta hydrolase superfamily lysophospholipase